MTTPKPGYNSLTKAQLIRALHIRDERIDYVDKRLQHMEQELADHEQIVGLFDGIGKDLSR